LWRSGCAEKGIHRPYWPSNIPDPIEHIWGWIKHKLSNLEVLPNTTNKLKAVITQIWNKIGRESIRKLYRGMPNRLRVFLIEKQRRQNFKLKF
jgi:hypothetical protein